MLQPLTEIIIPAQKAITINIDIDSGGRELKASIALNPNFATTLLMV
jgi:hypothetical protein